MKIISNLEKNIKMNIHLIAIGGSAMHNLAIALKKKNFNVTGSDDAIFEPSKSRLKKYDLLPIENGWFEHKITEQIDAIILGMHAREDNPELIKAQKLNIPIYSYPEYIYKQSQTKKRIVIGGSHGKTSITAMILHVLKNLNIDCDYLVGAQLEGFDTMVKLSNAPLIILEGDEYLSSPIDRRPKFHIYKPHIGVISGIAWDHINVFPTFENYIEQFRIFKNTVSEQLIYCNEDQELNKLMLEKTKCEIIDYGTPKHKIINGITSINDYDLKIFGIHNLQNLNAAMLVCMQIGIDKKTFLNEIKSFKGATNRLELISNEKDFSIYKDFAHSPSKLKATTLALKKQFPVRKLIACMELHTFSSLNKSFLKEYENSMNIVDIAIIYYNTETLKQKKLRDITKDEIKNAFKKTDLIVFTNSNKLEKHLKSIKSNNQNILLMSSGNFNGMDLNKII
jgi:UDP-N-acetylmuramate: L-alanyl-gamma-D-glutamyl-meso-diaminopimelate ligase